ncbi:ATP synthase F1 subunit epsilon [Sphingobacterium sp. MYb382]|uniref:ATP synthase F1 subunit epsilon n=1 Tax=Sphingobacterium sp. MYb382 TaxID=2745278 RepID=UPI00309E8BC2
MKLTIITPDKLAYDGEVTALTVPGTTGSFQILKDHAAIVSTLDDGKIIIQNGKDEIVLVIKGGVVEAKDNIITVLAEGIIED